MILHISFGCIPSSVLIAHAREHTPTNALREAVQGLNLPRKVLVHVASVVLHICVQASSQMAFSLHIWLVGTTSWAVTSQPDRCALPLFVPAADHIHPSQTCTYFGRLVTANQGQDETPENPHPQLHTCTRMWTSDTCRCVLTPSLALPQRRLAIALKKKLCQF